MNKSIHLHSVIHKNFTLFAGVLLCAYFSFHAFNGERSYSRLSHLMQISETQKIEISTLKSEKIALEKQVLMMRSETLSVDLAEEQIRKYLGYHHKDELVVLN